MHVSWQGQLLPSAPESSALSPFFLALESRQGFSSGAVSSLIADMCYQEQIRDTHKIDMTLQRGEEWLPLFCWSLTVVQGREQRSSGAQQG